jgi:predicted MPP superfamily phosphohydrolase
MRIVTIPDVHGHDRWKNAVYRINEDTDEIMYCRLGMTIDRVVFLGDYVDARGRTNNQILNNLLEIIQLKKDYPDNVILLWGNHDTAYVRNENISGFRPDMYHDLNELFRENRNLFQLAYQEGHNIWTHAGIHRGWWQYFVQPVLDEKTNTRFTPYLKDCKNIADILNLMFEFNYDPIFMVSHLRGGHDKVGGPLWADKQEIYTKPLAGYHQIVGHNAVNRVITYDFHDLTKLTFCDCLGTKEEFFKIDL